MQGWIKIHRAIKKHWVFQDSEKLKAWICILIDVNHEPKKVLLGGTLFECNRGDSLNSLDTWARTFGGTWNKSRVRRFFKLLENDSMIVLTNESKTTRLTVCNYDSYQGERNNDETIMKRKRNASETLATPNKNEENDNNEKNDKEYSSEIKNFTQSILKYFPIHPKKIKDWYSITEKLIRIDKYDLNTIEIIVKYFRADSFWIDNFQSYTKLRKKKDEGLYIDYFKNILISKNNGANQKTNPNRKTTAEGLRAIIDQFPDS